MLSPTFPFVAPGAVAVRSAVLGVLLAATGACRDATEPTLDGRARPLRSSTPHFALASISIADLGVPQGGESWASGIGGSSELVGSSLIAGSGNQYRATRWYNGVAQSLGTLGGEYSVAHGVNVAGEIVGSAADANGDGRAFVWRNGQMQPLDATAEPLTSTVARAINGRGMIVGFKTSRGDLGSPLVWRDGVRSDLPGLSLSATGRAADVNERGEIVGHSVTPLRQIHATLWTNDVPRDLHTLAGIRSEASAINEVGQVVGHIELADRSIQAFLWENGAMRTLGLPSAPPTTAGVYASSYADGINDLGQVVGHTDYSDGRTVAFLWQDDVAYELATLGGDRTIARAIANDGWVAGFSTPPGEVAHAVVWEVPVRASIDVSPDDPANAIRASGKDVISVAVLTTPFFDASRVTPASLTLGNDDGNDTPVDRRRSGEPLVVYRDVDRDGDLDLVAQFDKSTLVAKGDLGTTTTALVLRGSLLNGSLIRGRNRVTVTP